jgi:hypothetical protein
MDDDVPLLTIGELVSDPGFRWRIREMAAHAAEPGHAGPDGPEGRAAPWLG